MECHREDIPDTNGHTHDAEGRNGEMEEANEPKAALQFRCVRCTQSAHYQHRGLCLLSPWHQLTLDQYEIRSPQSKKPASRI